MRIDIGRTSHRIYQSYEILFCRGQRRTPLVFSCHIPGREDRNQAIGTVIGYAGRLINLKLE